CPTLPKSPVSASRVSAPAKSSHPDSFRSSSLSPRPINTIRPDFTARRRGSGQRGEEPDMRRLGLYAGVMLLILSSSGCVINQYSADENIRQEQLLFQSEDLR